MLGKLVPCGGGPPIALLKPKLVIGRLKTSDIPLSYLTVSARHCELELVDGYWRVRDLDSSNGTRVNRVLCSSEWLLPDDILEVSGFRFAVCYTPPAGQHAPRRLATSPPAEEFAAPKRSTVPATGAAPTDQQVWEPGLSVVSLGKLVPCGGGPPIRLFRPKLVVGRSTGCDVVLRWPTVSGRHCELTWTDGCWSVRDLGSRNGTRVDGSRVESRLLLPGSILWLGGLCFALVYVRQDELMLADQGHRLLAQDVIEKAGLVPGQAESASKDRNPDRL